MSVLQFPLPNCINFYICVKCSLCSVRPDWATYWTLGNFLKPLATIGLPKFPTILGNFFGSFKIYHFSSKMIFGAAFIDIWQFFSGHTDYVQSMIYSN